MPAAVVDLGDFDLQDLEKARGGLRVRGHSQMAAFRPRLRDRSLLAATLLACAVIAAVPLSRAHAEERGAVTLAQILSDRPISEGLRRPSIGGERLPDMLQRPDTRTEIRPQRRIIMPQNEVCRDEPIVRRTERGTVRELTRRCYLVPAR
jgi:hypothetical protein